MKVSKDFILQEFVPKVIFDKFGDKSIWFIDPTLFKVVQFLRDRYQLPITINDWHIGGKRQNAGFRLPDSNVGAKLSQHKFGRAVDLKWLNQNSLTIDNIRKDIHDNEKLFYSIGIRAVEEDTDTWLHVDVRNYNEVNKILFVSFWSKK